MSKEQNLMKQKNEKSELAAPAADSPPEELKAIFDPPTKLPIKCLLESQRSFVEDRRWAGKRTAEIVEKKYGGLRSTI